MLLEVIYILYIHTYIYKYVCIYITAMYIVVKNIYIYNI